MRSQLTAITPRIRWLRVSAVGFGTVAATSPFVLYVALRLPSLWEPHWYSDEAGYATTAWLSTHGLVLYQGVWNNKPPLLFWIYDLALWAFGPSEFGLHLLSMLAGVLTLLALGVALQGRVRGRGRVVPMVLAAVLLGVPLLGGDLALPENFLIAPEAWGMLLILQALERTDGRRLALAAPLLAAAVLIQQTALAAVAAALLLVMLRWGPGRVRSAVGLLLLTAAGVVAGVAPYLIWATPARVWFLLVASYRQYTVSSLPITAAAMLPRALAGALLLTGAFWRRRDPPIRLLATVWLAADLLLYLLPARPYPHFLLPSVVPACLALAAYWPLARRRWPGWRRAALPASGAISAAAWLALLATNASGLFGGLLTMEYLPLTVGRATGLVTSSQYLGAFGVTALAEAQAVAFLEAHHLDGESAMVWSADAWPYLLARLRPILPTPAIYMDSAWLGEAQLIGRVRTGRPQLILIAGYAVPAALRTILDSSYRVIERGAGGASLWMRR